MTDKCISIYNVLEGDITEDDPVECVSVMLDCGPKRVDTERGVIVGGTRHARITVENGRINLYCPDGQLDVRPLVQNVITVGVIS